VKNVTDANFETEVLKNSKTVLVDFWAEWCGPCLKVAPILEEISDEHGEKLEIVKLNVDENPVTPGNLGIIGIPAMFVYQNGEIVKQITGAKPKAALLRDLADYL
jgi:thioredoxin 1